MFKNALLYRILSTNLRDQLATLADAMDSQAFTPCGASQEKSIGWIPPRGEHHGALLESVGGQWILKLQAEVKRVPTAALKERVQQRCDEIEAQTGRKPGKKERRDLADDERLAMLPMVISHKYTTLLWIDPEANTLVVDTGSQGKADEAITMFIKAIGGLSISLINTQTAPAAAMAHWLREREAPANFTVDRECELKAADESKAVVKYGRHALDIDEVVQHITQGKLPTKLAMTWNERVSFVLTEGLQLKKLAILDVVFEDKAEDNKADAFDADVAIATAELSSLIADLVEALGGEVQAPASA